MATPAEIAQNASYTGDANLGGGNFGVITIDSKPLENLAAYTYAYNKTKWEQQQKDAQEKAKELADFTAYDLTTAIPEDSKKIQKEWNELYSWVQNNPTVLDYKNNQKGYLEYKKKRNDFENNLRGGKARDITYKAQLIAIEKETNPKLKAILQKRLDDNANSTELSQPIRVQQYNAAIPEVATPNIIKFDQSKIGRNFNVQRTYGFLDMKDVNNKSFAASMGLNSKILDMNSKVFTDLSPEEQKYKIEEFENRQASGVLLPVEQAKVFTEALTEFKNADGSIDMDRLNKSNPLLSDYIAQVEVANNYIRTKKEEIKAGIYEDELGSLGFSNGRLNEKDWTEIDFSDGIQPFEIEKVRIMAKAIPDTYSTKIDQTDLAIKKDKNALDWSRLKLDKDEFGLKQKQFEQSQKGTETQVNGAIERAKRIYSDMLKFADENGVIDNNAIRKLNVEQLKYLGIEVPDKVDAESGKIIKGGFRPLDLSGENQYAIQLINGEVKVYKPKDGETTLNKTKEGLIFGLLDNTKSTNIFNMGTNILNEELKNAGSKELTPYWGIDVTGNPTSFTQNTESKTTSSSSAVKTVGDPDANLNDAQYYMKYKKGRK